MKKFIEFIAKNFEGIVSLDLRALGFFRIFLGAIILIDMLDRLKDVAIFYSAGGVNVVGDNSNIFAGLSFSINNLNGSVNYQAFILIIAAILALLFLIGYRTRIVAVILWIFVVSIQNRNFIIIQGGDDYIRLLLFWAMFLPVNLRLSYDYFKNKTKFKKIENKFISPANIGLIFQVFFLYYFSALSKSDPIWNKDFTAIYYALNIDIFVTWFGRILLTLKPLLKPLTAFVYYLEYYVGFVLIFPFYNYIWRTIGVLLIVMLHIGIGTTLDVGPFPWVAICGILSLMPTETIDFLINKLKKNNKVNLLLKKVNFQKFIPQENDMELSILPNGIKENIFMVSTILLALITFSVTFVSYIWNTDNNKGNIPLPKNIQAAVNFLRLDQNWAMFAPYPFTDDGWYVITATDENNKDIQLFGTVEKTTVDKKPDNYSQDFKNERWRKFMTNLYYARYSSIRTELLNYMCKEWNSNPTNTIKLKSIQMYYMLERTQPEGQQFKVEKQDFGNVKCGIS